MMISKRWTIQEALLIVHPLRIVCGEVKSKANPNGKTVLFYNPNEVPPEEPVELWDMMILLADA